MNLGKYIQIKYRLQPGMTSFSTFSYFYSCVKIKSMRAFLYSVIFSFVTKYKE